MKISRAAPLLERLASAVTKLSGSTMNVRVWSPIGVFAGTVQLTSTRASEYGASSGRFPLTVVPSGVTISISVVGEVRTPLF